MIYFLNKKKTKTVIYEKLKKKKKGTQDTFFLNIKKEIIN